MFSPRVHTREFKLTLMRQLASGEKRPAQVCREHQLAERVLSRWREEYAELGLHSDLWEIHLAHAELRPDRAPESLGRARALLGTIDAETDLVERFDALARARAMSNWQLAIGN